jgi:hypothetical protein
MDVSVYHTMINYISGTAQSYSGAMPVVQLSISCCVAVLWSNHSLQNLCCQLRSATVHTYTRAVAVLRSLATAPQNTLKQH